MSTSKSRAETDARAFFMSLELQQEWEKTDRLIPALKESIEKYPIAEVIPSIKTVIHSETQQARLFLELAEVRASLDTESDEEKIVSVEEQNQYLREATAILLRREIRRQAASAETLSLLQQPSRL